MAASSNRIADMARQLPPALRRLEQQAAMDATRPLAEALRTALQEAVQAWIRETKPHEHAPGAGALERLTQVIKRVLARAFAGTGRQAQRDIERAAFNAAHLSAQQTASITAAMRGEPTPPVTPTIGPDAAAAARAVPAAVEEEHASALALLTATTLTALGVAGVHSVFQRARRAVTRIGRALAVATTSAAAHAARAVAAVISPTVRLLWVAEPGACPACAAYAGRSVRPGREFPGGLSLDPQRTVFDTPISGPPRHPHCRCVLIPWLPGWPVDGTPLPTLLRRHARTGVR
jgi:NCAIR mutase (PurE)-related protein